MTVVSPIVSPRANRPAFPCGGGPARARGWARTREALAAALLSALLAIVLSIVSSPAHAAWRESTETIKSRGDVSVSYLAARAAGKAKDGKETVNDSPADIVVFFPGGAGFVRPAHAGLSEHGERPSLIGSFAEKLGMAVAVGLPSDMKDGLPFEWRNGKDHVADAGAVIDEMAKRYPMARISLVGMSNGTRSVTTVGAAVARRGSPKVASIVAMAVAGDALSDFNMAAIESARIPVLVVHHKRDSCLLWTDAAERAKRYDTILVDDHRLPRASGFNRDCSPASAHSFANKEATVYQAIADWILTGKVKESLL